MLKLNIMKNGQIDVNGILAIFLIIFVVLPIVGVTIAIMTNATCHSWITQLNDCQKLRDNYKQQYEFADANYKACLVAYDSLEKTKITKDDFAMFNGNLEKALIQNQQINSNIINIQNQINQIQNVSNNFFLLGVAITFEFSLFSLAIIDILFFKFKHSKNIINKIYNWRNKTEVNIGVKQNGKL